MFQWIVFLSSRNILIVNTSYCINFLNTQWPLLLLSFRLWPVLDLEAKWLSLPWLLITEDTVLKLRQLLGNTVLREHFWYLLCLCWCYRLMQSMIYLQLVTKINATAKWKQSETILAFRWYKVNVCFLWFCVVSMCLKLHGELHNWEMQNQAS